MIKNFYIVAWLVLAGSVLVSLFTGSVSDLGLLTYGLIALALVYGLAFWSVFVNPGEPRHE